MIREKEPRELPDHSIQTPETDRASRLTMRLLDDLIGEDTTGQVGVRLWNGMTWPDTVPRAATLVLNHPGALRAMFLPGDEASLAEAYLYDDFDIEGEIEAVSPLADTLDLTKIGWMRKLRLARDLLRFPPTSLRQTQEPAIPATKR